MKIKRLLKIFIVGLFASVFCGCKKELPPIIYANHDISACGVDDPLVNLTWLANNCEELQDKKYERATINLLQDTISESYGFLIKKFYKNNKGYMRIGLDCSGEWKFSNGYFPNEPCVPVDPIYEKEFRKNKKDLGVIWSMKR